MKKKMFRERYGFKNLEIIPKKDKKEIKEEEIYVKPIKKASKKKEEK